jgi:hypothetical protein
MDQVTQQNSALVEQNAAAAKALEQQSHAMDERVSFFRLERRPKGNGVSQPAVVVRARPATNGVKHAAPAAKQSGRAQAALATPDLLRGSGQRGNSMNARAGHSPEGSSARAPLATAMGDDPEWDELEAVQAVG